MKRSFTFFSLLVLLVWSVASCATQPSTVAIEMPPPEVVEQTEQVEQIEEDVENAEMASPTLEEGPRTVVGSFRSVKGVMNSLSCYCSNGGYVESPAGEEVAVCFKDDVTISSRDYIEVTGFITTRSIESNGACPAGTKSYMVVESYKLNP